MSKFKVMSRKDCEKYCSQPANPNFVIISISTENVLPYANFQLSLSLKDVLYLHFNDVEKNEPYAITQRDADLIYNFTHHYFYDQDIEKIIVHCDAGVSRSAGICAALMNIFEGDDWAIFDNPKYCPNMTCYRSLLECHYGILDRYQKEEIEKKNQHNIKIWKEHNNI